MMKKAGIEGYDIESRVLLSFVTGLSSAKILAEPELRVSVDTKEHFIQAVRRRCGGYPLQYITGVQEFRSRTFIVNEYVLIPRPETEDIVDEVLKRLKKGGAFLDVGTGSGCIAVSAALEFAEADIFACDISRDAVGVAVDNAYKNGCGERISFFVADVFEPLDRIQLPLFDVIASNPPYIAEGEKDRLQREVRDHEPWDALFAGGKGLDVIERLVRDAGNFLKQDGYLIMEIGHNQLEEVRNLAAAHGWYVEGIRRDFQDIPRIVTLRKE